MEIFFFIIIIFSIMIVTTAALTIMAQIELNKHCEDVSFLKHLEAKNSKEKTNILTWFFIVVTSPILIAVALTVRFIFLFTSDYKCVNGVCKKVPNKELGESNECECECECECERERECECDNR